MKVRELNIRRGLVTSLFLIIIGGIVFNSTYFLHSHKLDKGSVIFHAHPYDKHGEKEDPCSKHEHGKMDLQVISSLDYFELLKISISLDLIEDVILDLSCKSCILSSSIIVDLFTTRAPPSESKV